MMCIRTYVRMYCTCTCTCTCMYVQVYVNSMFLNLGYLHELQSKYVLVPADKAANNIIVVCKKYYLEVVLKELRTTNTYKHVDRECMDVVTEHLKFMTKYKIYVDHDLRY